MKLLVTGGAGFIGDNFVLYMLQQHPDYKIINVDSLTYAGNLENLKSIENTRTIRSPRRILPTLRQLMPCSNKVLTL